MAGPTQDLRYVLVAMSRRRPAALPTLPQSLPPAFAAWFAARGWRPRPHQIDVLEAARAGSHVLLIAPTGGGKTLSGFLPSLIALAERPVPAEDAPPRGVHTLYLSPLKALATDIARNLMDPVTEMDLPIRVETRTGDTPQNRRQRQRETPPDILLTTPESLSLLLSLDGAPTMFRDLRSIILDEVHALAGTKRGDLLSLGLARLDRLAPEAVRIGLSATVAHKVPLAAYVSADGQGGNVTLIEVADPAPPDLSIMLPAGHLPWSGHMGLASAPEILERVSAAGLTIIFVNTRAQAELLFQAFGSLTTDTLPIAIHHGSLDVRSAAQGRGRDGRGAAARAWSPPPRSIWASTGAASIR